MVTLERHTSSALPQVLRLLNACFPRNKKITASYLDWLYRQNPDGKVIGINAVESDGAVVAHYAIAPAQWGTDTGRFQAALSINTATHPAYQGRGLFVKTARATYEVAAAEGIEVVFGVANGNSTPGFIRKLDFKSPGNVSLAVCTRAHLDSLEGSPRSIYSIDKLTWRLNNPSTRYFISKAGSCELIFAAKRGISVLLGSAEEIQPYTSHQRKPKPTLFLRPSFGMGQGTSGWRIPSRLLPSPWNFIYKKLRDIDVDLDRTYLRGLDMDTF